MAKRILDILVSLTGILLLSPLLILLSVAILFDSKGPVFYKQKRIGKNAVPFLIWKFRTMRLNADQLGYLTVGGRDPRITRVGYYLRRYKLDELPQLFNVLFGTMSLVGPRPEVEKYVLLYTAEQRKVLNVKPGITDFASIEYLHENDLLGASSDPEKTYIDEIMPAKIQMNMKYIENPGVLTDVRLIWQTVKKIISRHFDAIGTSCY